MSCDANGNCECPGPFCAIAPGRALGWPKNIGHATAPHQAMIARFAQQAAKAVYVSGTGDELFADQVITVGHKHNTAASLIEWRQLAAWPVIGRDNAATVRVGQEFFDTLAGDLGLYTFRMPMKSGGGRVTDVIYPRLRATVPSPTGAATTTLVITGDIVRFVAGVITVVQALPTLNIGSLAGPPVVSYSNRWFGWGALEIDPAVADARVGLLLRAAVLTAGERGTIFEVAVGLRGGL